MLTKKDFIKFAENLAKIDDVFERKRQTDAQIEILRETNPKFDEDRFRRYVEAKAKQQ